MAEQYRSSGVTFSPTSSCCASPVSPLPGKLSATGGDDAGAWTLCRSYQHVSVGPAYAPELEKRCRPHLKATTNWWKVDETSIKVKKEWVSLYRAVDSQGHTLDFWFSPTRDAKAAKHFFLAPLATSPTSDPRVINVNKNAAYPKAAAELKAEGDIPENCELRQVKYLNNLVEQDHRFIQHFVNG